MGNSGIKHVLELVFILGRHDDDIGNRTHISEVKHAVMRWPVRANEPSPI